MKGRYNYKMSKQYNQSQKGDSLDVRGHDLYETPWQATRALCIEGGVSCQYLWESCYGRGAIVEEFKRQPNKSGYKWITSDVVCHDINNPPDVVKDFLSITKLDFPGVNLENYNIVTNPPFKSLLPQKFVLHRIKSSS